MGAGGKRILEELKTVEFEGVHYDLPGVECYGYVPGRIPILLSAPHGTRHFRQNRWKGEDEYTSALAVVLGRLTKAHVLYAKYKTSEDPNHDGISKYKTLLQEIVGEYGIRFLLDLHGADRRHPFKIDVGTRTEEADESSCPTYREVIESVFSDFEFPLFNRVFPARGEGTITSFCRNELGIEAAQFEINGKYRILHRKPDSSWARMGREADYRAGERDVLEIVSRMVALIRRIHTKMEA